MKYGGTYSEQQQSFKDLVFVLILAIVLVFLVLLFEFRTVSGMLPLAFALSAGAHMLQPLAIAVIGGIVAVIRAVSRAQAHAGLKPGTSIGWIARNCPAA